MTNRKIPQGRGALRALLVAPRTFAFYVCMGGCMRSLYFTFAGETCPFDDCGVPGADGRTIDFRSRSPLTPAPDGTATPTAPKRRGPAGGRRRSGKRRRRARAEDHNAATPAG